MTPTESQTFGSLSYDEVGESQQESAITIHGVAKLASRIASLQINGKSVCDDLPTQLRITAGPPIVFPDPASRQTRPVEGGHYAELIKQSIGEFHFLAAFEDREMRINEPDRLFGSVIVSESMFADLWQCARTPNCKFHSVFFEVFGERMQCVKSYGRTEFNWTVPDMPSSIGLHIASFRYVAGQGKYEAGTA